PLFSLPPPAAVFPSSTGDQNQSPPPPSPISDLASLDTAPPSTSSKPGPPSPQIPGRPLKRQPAKTPTKSDADFAPFPPFVVSSICRARSLQIIRPRSIVLPTGLRRFR
ncbi:unnamed protein product, partial [Linum tenue]